MPKTPQATVFLIVACALCALAPGAALAGTLDQQQADGSSTGVDAYSGSSLAQTFTAGLSGKLDQVDLHLGKSLTPGAPLSVEIRDVSAGTPGNTVLAGQGVPASSVPATPAFVSINFPTPASVAAGTQYAIVAYSSTGFSNTYSWNVGATVNSYVGGVGYFTSSSPPTDGWTPLANDLAFKTYVAPPTPQTPTGQRAAALKKCKKKHSARARKKCRKKANLLPV